MAFLDETGLAYFWNQILARLNKFVPAESGKGLSSNDYTDEEKEKLAGIEVGANKTIVDSTLSATSTNPVQNKVVNTKFETIQAEVDSKVDSIDGKGLSTEDYTTEEKTKLASIAEGAEVNVQADWNEADTSSDAYIVNKPTIPSKTSDLTNDSGFLTSIPDEYVTETELTAKGYLTSYTETDPTVPAWAKQPTKPTYTAAEVGALPDTYIPPNQTAQQVGADPTGTATTAVSQHNVNTAAHNDLRLSLQELATRVNAALDSDDTTLDQMSEVVAYIKSNKTLIDAITTSKVSVADIVNDLSTNMTDKPLSAAQGVAIKTLIDALRNDKMDAAELTNAINPALAQAKASGEFDGADGKSAYQYAQEGGYTGTETAFAAKMAAEIPTALPNPNALTFTGAVTGSYDGSAPLEVAIPSGGGGSGKAKTEKLIDVTFEEATAMVSVTLEHNFHRLYLAWSCGSNGVARIVDTDGNDASGSLCLCLDSTSAGWNERKIGQISTNTNTWQSSALLSDWTDDVSTFIGAYVYSISTGIAANMYNVFGGTTAMAGTLGANGLTPTAGRTLNVFPSAGLFAATTRIVLVGEYYE